MSVGRNDTTISKMFILSLQSSFLAEAAAVHRSFTADPAISPWLLAPGVILVGAMILLLYRAQRRAASHRLVAVLTFVRLALIVLTFALLFRPVWVWSQISSNPPTLWVLIDQSQSMAQVDRQATPAEQLHWADALGSVDHGKTFSHLDSSIARLSAFHDDLPNLRKELAAPSQASGNLAVEQRIARADDWVDRLNSTLDGISRSVGRPTPDLRDLLIDARSASKHLRETIAAPAARPTSRDRASDAVWQRLSSVLENLFVQVQPVARQADDNFVRTLAGDSNAKTALQKIADSRRADLSFAALMKIPRMREALASHRTGIIAFGVEPKVLRADDGIDPSAAIKSAVEPIDSATDLAGALRFVSDRIEEGDPASVLLISDGRQTVGGDAADAAHHLAARGVRVFTLAVGSRQLAPDAAVEAIDAPDWVYKEDTVRLRADLRFDALAGKPARVELSRDGTLMDTQTVTIAGANASQVLTFSDKPPAPGVYSYDVRIAPIDGEAVMDNNSRRLRVAVKQDKLQVLVIEDQPRWEYRYLVNDLKRDARVHLQSVLLEPAQVEKIAPPPAVKASATNDRDEAQLLPQTPQEWAAFDLVVIGDVPPEFLGDEAQKNIARAVRDRGTTLAVIAGPLNMPARYTGTPLADLLPVESSSNWTAKQMADHLRGGFRVLAAPEGSASILNQLGLDEAANVRLWSALPAWYWHSEQTQAKPSASVLWQIGDVTYSSETAASTDNPLSIARRRALLATMPLGLGKVMYLAGDSSWRLRQVDGQNVHERFWGQVIRWAAGSDMPAGGKLVRFGVDRSQAVVGQTIQVSARALKPDFTPLMQSSLQVVARSTGKVFAEARMQDSPQTPGLYHGQLTGLAAGSYELELQGTEVEKLLAADSSANQKTLSIDVVPQSLVEHQNINPDRSALAQIAGEGGGIAVDAEYADVLAEFLPTSRREQTSTRQLGLFGDPHSPTTRAAHWGFLALFVLLISTEWVLRKIGGLV